MYFKITLVQENEKAVQEHDHKIWIQSIQRGAMLLKLSRSYTAWDFVEYHHTRLDRLSLLRTFRAMSSPKNNVSSMYLYET